MSGSSGNKVLDRGPVRFLTYFDHVSSVQSAECMASYGRASPAQGHVCRHGLKLGLLDLMPPTICCVRSKSVRDFVTEISGGARRHRCGVAQSSSSELATQAPAQPAPYIVASGCP